MEPGGLFSKYISFILQIKILPGYIGMNNSFLGKRHMVRNSQHKKRLRSCEYPSIHPSHKRFLRILVGQDHYTFRVLLFFCLTAVRGLHEGLFRVAAQIRWKEYTVFLYLDNWLLTGRFHLEVLLATWSLLCLLASMRIWVNRKMFTLILMQIIDFIVVTLDSTKERATFLWTDSTPSTV